MISENKQKKKIKTGMIASRPSWEAHAMNLALMAKERSEDPYQKVGACILGHDNEVLSVAYNGLIAGFKTPNGFWENRDFRRPFMIHAETNCLARINRGEGKILACTLLPCSSCATNIAAHGIKKVVYKEIYNRDTLSLEIFRFYKIDCNQIS
jgi:dCMP deaminase